MSAIAPHSASAHSPFNIGKPGPKPGTPRRGPRIDLSTLTIKSGIPLPKGRNIVGKYEGYFSKLKPKDVIECAPDDVAPVATSLRKYLRDTKQDKTLTTISQKNTEDNPKIGRIWLWPKDEITNAIAPVSAQAKANRASQGKRAAK